MSKRFIPFLLLMLCGLVRAETVYRTSQAPVVFGSNADAVCRGALPSGVVFTSTNSGSCWGYATGNPSYVYAYNTWFTTTMTDCPTGTVRNSSGTCGPPPPREPKCTAPAGTNISWMQKTGHSASPNATKGDGAAPPWPTTSPDCGVSSKPGVENCWSAAASDGGQDFYCKFTGTSNGANAPTGTPAGASVTAPSADAKPTNAPETQPDSNTGNCPSGTVQGGIDRDGIPICMGNGTNPTGSAGKGSATDVRPTSSVTSKSTDASGNAVETTTQTRANSDGSTTTTITTTTTKADGTKTSSTDSKTGTNAAGLQGKPDAPETDMCKLHPELNICKNSSVTGSCGAIACQGDAIQCATLKQAAAMRCKAETDEAAIKATGAWSLGNNVLNGQDPLAGTLPKPGAGTSVNAPTSLDTAGWLGAGQCFADKSITFMDQTVTIPFSKACDMLVALRYALMVIAGLASFKIMRGAFLSE